VGDALNIDFVRHRLRPHVAGIREGPSSFQFGGDHPFDDDLPPHALLSSEVTQRTSSTGAPRERRPRRIRLNLAVAASPRQADHRLGADDDGDRRGPAALDIFFHMLAAALQIIDKQPSLLAPFN
jgi:hypothetical protein